jgi:hypothetical protein
MVGMEMLPIVVLVVAVGVAAALAGVEASRRRLTATQPPPAHPVAPDVPLDEVFRDALAEALAALRTQSEASARAVLEQAAVLNREQVGAAAQHAREQSVAELGARHEVIDTRLDQVQTEMRAELGNLGSIVSTLISRCGAMPRSPMPWRSRHRRCARRWPRRPRAANGASGWPKTCCGWRDSSRT